nr:retrotransposon protein, putative, Ty1-copia subclass [Tanacetum cinerariifolium]
MGYYFYYPLENKIFVAQNVEFFKNSLMVKEASGSHGLLESSGSDEGLELIQEEDTQPSANTSEVHNEVAPIEVKPQNVKVPICRSTRIPQAPDRYSFSVDVEEYELGDFNEPPNYKAVLSDLEFNKWLEDMNTKMQSMKDSQQNPGEIHWTDVKAILKYLRNTKDMDLMYGEKPKAEIKVFCYADASFQRDKDDTKSQTEYVFVLNGGGIDWKSAKQSTTPISSTKVVKAQEFSFNKLAVFV